MKLRTLAFGFAIFVLPALASAQLPAPNAAGVSIGHQHLYVADVAKSREMWLAFGARDVSSDKLKNIFAIPGVLIMLREQKDTVPSGQTVANHVAFSVKNYADIKAKVAALGGKVMLDKTDGPGQLLADMPDGVRVEFVGAPDQQEAIKFHHLHVQAVDLPPLREWYLKVFGAETGERAGMPSAVFTDGRVDFLVARTAPKPSAGGAIDHFGFEVADMAVFKKRMDQLGIKFEREPEKRDDLGLTIAFITDPVGTRIEITQGMAAIGKK